MYILEIVSGYKMRLCFRRSFTKKIMIKPLRRYSTLIPSYYITTPIYYVNASPHIGHLYSSVIADAIQRFQKLIHPEENVIFSTGTDEHGTKIQQSATKHNQPLNEYCLNVSNSYKEMFQCFSVDYTRFIRTTEAKYKEAVHKFWETIDKNGCVYSANYSGWYCIADETFLSDLEVTDQILSNGQKIKVSKESGHPVEWTEEQNYMFKLSNFQDNLKNWLLRNENAVQPKKFHKILLNWITKDEMRDVSISRPISRVHWGIKVPGDSTQTIYVWMDALINYLSVVGYPNELNCWPPNVQVIGKDILKFHGIYWPAFLMAASLKLPKTILCHSHWTVDGEKMSKSKSNVISPIKLSNTYTNEGIRYFLLREGITHRDGNYSEVKLMRILNSELADTFGNLLSRCCGNALNPIQTIPPLNKTAFNEITKIEAGKKLIELVESLENVCFKHYENYNFYKVVDSVINTLHAANLFVETMKPWELRKKIELIPQLEITLHLTFETLRVSGIILQPIIPQLSKQLLDKLNVDPNKRFWNDLKRMSWNVDETKEIVELSKEKTILFKRILTEREDKEKKKEKNKLK
nr:methionine--tRNA ligase, mitochondrial isoform X1 [Onthophagus taurus]